MAENCAIILAEAEKESVQSTKPIIMAEIIFRPIIYRVTEAVKKAGINDICVVTENKSEILEKYLNGKIKTVKQTKKTGICHALIQAKDFISEHKNADILILNGNTPFMNEKTITDSLSYHIDGGFAQTVITGKIANEISSEAMWFKANELTAFLERITCSTSPEANTEKIILNKEKKVGIFTVSDTDTLLKANTQLQINEWNDKLRRKTLNKLMLQGVSIPCTDGVIIDDEAEIGTDTVILPGTIIKSGVKIGTGCEIGPNTVLIETTVGNNCVLNSVQAEYASVSDNATIGPFVHLRPDAHIGNGVRCGNFVEIKNSVIGAKTSVSHLTYVGDSDVGKNVNLGCGVVTVNFNGKTKNRTTIEDNAFIGCNTNLIAPVRVGKAAYTAAGSTITKDVPENALAVARERQTNKENWVSINKPYREKK